MGSPMSIGFGVRTTPFRSQNKTSPGGTHRPGGSGPPDSFPLGPRRPAIANVSTTACVAAATQATTPSELLGVGGALKAELVHGGCFEGEGAILACGADRAMLHPAPPPS